MTRATWVAAALALGCRSSATGPGAGESEAEAESESEAEAEGGSMATIYDVQNGMVSPGTIVTLDHVVVTAVDNFMEPQPPGRMAQTGNVYVQEPMPGADGTFKRSGVYVYGPTRVDSQNGAVTDLVPGDVVNVTGAVCEFWLDTSMSPAMHHCDSAPAATRTFTEISKPAAGHAQIERVGHVSPLAPSMITGADLATDSRNPLTEPAEDWEGVLVTLTDAALTGTADQYGSLRALAGGQCIALDQNFGAVADDTCYASVTGPVFYLFDYSIEPRSMADLVAGGSCNGAMTVRPIADVQSGMVAQNSAVTVQGVAVAVDANPPLHGYFVQDSTVAGGGIYVYGSPSPDVTQGASMTVTGTYKLFHMVTELDQCIRTVGPAAMLPAPTVIQATAGDADLSPYESMLVEVHGVTIGAPSTSGSASDTHHAFSVGANLFVEDDLFAGAGTLTMGAHYSVIRGALHKSYDQYRILPRAAGDLVP